MSAVRPPGTRRVNASRADFVAGRTTCPSCGTAVGTRDVTREHLDVPPDPPYAASVKCPKCGNLYEVVFV